MRSKIIFEITNPAAKIKKTIKLIYVRGSAKAMAMPQPRIDMGVLKFFKKSLIVSKILADNNT